MHTTAETSKRAEGTRPDQFIPVRREDLFGALIKQGDLADPAQRELFWRFARTLRTICHYEYFRKMLTGRARATPDNGPMVPGVLAEGCKPDPQI